MGLTFYGQDLYDNWGISVDSSKSWEKPERDREFIHVPGRSGDLILDRGSWMNVEIEYNCHIDRDFASRFEDFVRWLSTVKTYEVLTDDNHPDVYRMAIPLIEEVSPKTTFTTETGDFTLLFNCKPQQFINDGIDHVVTLDFSESDISAEIDPYPPVRGGWTGSPLVTVYAPSGAFFTIEGADGTWQFEVAAFPAHRMIIDFETGNAVLVDDMGEPLGNGNPYLTVTPPGVFSPDFPPSSGTIYAFHTNGETTYSGSMELNPRFWRI